MPYRVVIHTGVVKKIASWGLPDDVLVDVYLCLKETLPASPGLLLRRAKRPFDGMQLEFSLIDPQNRLREHSFVFLAVYSQDEETLIIAQAGYERREGI